MPLVDRLEQGSPFQEDRLQSPLTHSLTQRHKLSNCSPIVGKDAVESLGKGSQGKIEMVEPGQPLELEGHKPTHALPVGPPEESRPVEWTVYIGQGFVILGRPQEQPP